MSGSTAHRILLVEDEDHLLEAIKLNLEFEGYSIVTATNGMKAVQLFREGRFSLVILDVMLPEMDGFGVCEIIRLENAEVPILFLTAKNTSEDRIQGLKRGADDYLTKPFNLEELLLRVGILVRRSVRNIPGASLASSFRIGDTLVNFSRYEYNDKEGNTFPLTKKEVMLLKLLIERKGEVVSREMILDRVWNYDVFPSTRTIDNFISSFRKYFEVNPKEPRFFHSVRGIGYKYTD